MKKEDFDLICYLWLIGLLFISVFGGILIFVGGLCLYSLARFDLIIFENYLFSVFLILCGLLFLSPFFEVKIKKFLKFLILFRCLPSPSNRRKLESRGKEALRDVGFYMEILEGFFDKPGGDRDRAEAARRALAALNRRIVEIKEILDSFSF